MSDRRNPLRNEDGNAAVEFALVAPVFFALLLGIIQVGWQLHCASSTRYALEREARALTIDSDLTASDIETAMLARLHGISSNAVAVTLQNQTISGVAAITATATYQGTLVVPFIGDYPLTFNSSVTVPVI